MDEKNTWQRFHPPGDPYALEGDEEQGYRAGATLPPGRHGSGLRVLLKEPGKEYGGAAAAAGLPVAEGTVSVERTDLGIGTLYVYRETIALGTDPVRFRAEAAGYADLALRVLLEACRTKWPDLDWDPVEDHARRELLPRVVQAVLAVHQSLGGLLDHYRAHRYGDDPALWLSNPHVQVILAELRKLGVERKADAPAPKRVKDYFNDGDWELGTKLLDEFIEPLPAERREEVKAGLLDLDDTFEDVWPQVEKKLGLERPAEELEEKLRQFIVAGLGAYFVNGIFDTFRVKASVRMPGRVLGTNGGLGALPEVRWDLGQIPLALAEPQFVAHSFVPKQGLGDRPWSLDALIEVRDRRSELTPAESRVLDAAVAKALADGWGDGPAESSEGETVHEIYRLLRELCEAK